MLHNGEFGIELLQFLQQLKEGDFVLVITIISSNWPPYNEGHTEVER